VVWFAVIALALYAARWERPRWSVAHGYRLIIGGGVVLPMVVLAALLAYGLPAIGRLSPPPQEDAVQVAVAGEQWWWRVSYSTPAGAVELANELRLPLGQRTDITLTSDNVIHAFWVPSLAGKVDLVPGRRTRISLEPSRTGTFGGVCAEYCGTAHALMGFRVVVMPAEAFAEWLAAQARAASEPATTDAMRGRTLFAKNGCPACHVIRGADPGGRIGPDLTHVGGRSLLAGVLPNRSDTMVQWLSAPHRVKPGARMPPFGMLPAADLRALAAYVSGLQ